MENLILNLIFGFIAFVTVSLVVVLIIDAFNATK
jgi:hypothetical protein